MNNGEISKIAVAELIGRCLSEVKNDMVAPNRKAERINCKPMCFVRSSLVTNGERTTNAITVCEVYRAQTTCKGWWRSVSPLAMPSIIENKNNVVKNSNVPFVSGPNPLKKRNALVILDRLPEQHQSWSRDLQELRGRFRSCHPSPWGG